MLRCVSGVCVVWFLQFVSVCGVYRGTGAWCCSVICTSVVFSCVLFVTYYQWLLAIQYCILCCWRVMSDKADTARAGSASNPLTCTPLSTFSSDLHGTFIEISCGSYNNQLYLDKIQNVSSKRITSKCILCAGTCKWYTPGELEGVGGKGKFKSWRRSIFHDGRPIGDYFLSCQPNDTVTTLSSQSVDTVIDTAPGSPATHFPVQPVSAEGMEATQSPQFIINAALAFIKAYHLKGDVCSLKTAVLDKCDSF